ncbi:hypothetical protein J2X69_003622 [Algoriphagus sp. 4150]|nr:hypothetical protein [Algoriphagus sp. 4150]
MGLYSRLVEKAGMFWMFMANSCPALYLFSSIAAGYYLVI